MAALPDWADCKVQRSSGRSKSPKNAYEFAQSVYKETKGATPALRELVRSYKSDKATGAIRTASGHNTGNKR